MGKVFRYTLEVRGYELDSFGHVNNAVYLNYLETARWAVLKEHNITLETMQTLKRWPVIASVEAQYIRPLFMGDKIEIRTSFPEHSRAAFFIDQEIYKGDQLVFKAKLKSVIINENGRPESIPEQYAQIW